MTTPVYDALLLEHLDFDPELPCDITEQYVECEHDAAWLATIESVCGHETTLPVCEMHHGLLTDADVSPAGECPQCGELGPCRVIRAERLR